MLRYRAFTIEPEASSMGSPIEFDAPDDEAAMKHVTDVAKGKDIQLWEGGRFVRVIKNQAQG